MAKAPSLRPTGARLAVELLALGAMLLAAAARAEPPSPRHEDQLDAIVRFLQNDQNSDGGFGGEASATSDPLFSAWVALALAAAGINPQDQARPGGVDAYTYLAEHSSALTLTTDFERALLVADAAGTSPHDFGGVDLVKTILERQLPDGSFSHEAGSTVGGMNDTIFAILSLGPVHEPAAEAAVQNAAAWVIEEQDADGSWPSYCPKTVTGCTARGKEPPDSVDMTGAAIEALNAAGLHHTKAQGRAFEYLHEAQLPDGGFPQALGEHESNVASTAWAVQGIWSAAGNPETWLTGSGAETEEPLDYMASLQQPDGHIRYERSRESLGVWMTAYVAPAFAGQALPIPLAPRSAKSTPGIAETGQGGESAQPGGGVIAGGGGRGAPLFSRPRPQSRGRTPGGKRVVGNKNEHPVDHSRTGRGSATQPAGTASTEATTSPPESSKEGAGLRTGSTRSVPSTGHVAAGSPGPRRRLPVSTAAKSANGGQGSDREVSGVIVGTSTSASMQGNLAFGAPGLHGAGAGTGQSRWPAIGIGTAALLLALFGAQRERHRQEVLL